MTETMTITTSAPATDAEPNFLVRFRRIHAAMRRDAARLPRVAASASSPEELAAVRRWFHLFQQMLVAHHEREDSLIWPELVRRDPTFAVAQHELLADHHELDDALAAAQAALAGDGDVLATVQRLADVLVAHLAREEAAAFPRLLTCFTAEEWEGVERQILKATGLRHLAFEVPWLLDGLTPDELAEIEAGAPMLLRVLHRMAFQPRYQRIAAPLLAVA